MGSAGRPQGLFLPTVGAHHLHVITSGVALRRSLLCRIFPSWSQTSQEAWVRNRPRSRRAHMGMAWVCVSERPVPVPRRGPMLARSLCPPLGTHASCSTNTPEMAHEVSRSNLLYAKYVSYLRAHPSEFVSPCTDPQKHWLIQWPRGLLSKERWLPASNAVGVSRHLPEQLFLSVAMRTI